MKKMMMAFSMLAFAAAASADTLNANDADGRVPADPAVTSMQSLPCRTEAGEKNLSGEAWMAFMQECVKRAPAPAAANPAPTMTERGPDPDGQVNATPGVTRDKVSACRSEANDRKLSGTARHEFLVACASPDAPSPSVIPSGTSKETAATPDADGRTSANAGAARDQLLACRKQAIDQNIPKDDQRAFVRKCVQADPQK